MAPKKGKPEKATPDEGTCELYSSQILRWRIDHQVRLHDDPGLLEYVSCSVHTTPQNAMNLGLTSFSGHEEQQKYVGDVVCYQVSLVSSLCDLVVRIRLVTLSSSGGEAHSAWRQAIDVSTNLHNKVTKGMPSWIKMAQPGLTESHTAA